MLFAAVATGQVSVKGRVTDSEGAPLTGVIVVAGVISPTTVTDLNGEFSLIINSYHEILRFLHPAYRAVSLPLNGMTIVELVMMKAVSNNDGMVVTALGLKRNKKSLPYATQQISGTEIKKTPTLNIQNNLAGKIAGLTIAESGEGLGSSTKISLRGNRYILGNNQPLVVVDGTPINSMKLAYSVENFAQWQDNPRDFTLDQGDGLAAITASDIESISVLKGAAASALYGAQGANGAIIITTKRCTEEKLKINLNSSFRADIPYMTYQFQDRYTMGYKGILEESWVQWGAKTTDQGMNNDFVKDFFNTGELWVNSVAISGGSKSIKNHLSYQNSNGKGIMPQNSINRHNLGLRTTVSLLGNRFESDASIRYMQQDIGNAPTVSNQYFNPIAGLYLFPAGGAEFTKYKENFEIMAPGSDLMKSNWPDHAEFTNPYWLVNRHNIEHDAEKVIAKLNLSFNLTKELTIKLRGSHDHSTAHSSQKTHHGHKYFTFNNGGLYGGFTNKNTEQYADALISYTKSFGKFGISTTAGASIHKQKTNAEDMHGQLMKPNVFTTDNFIYDPSSVEHHRTLTTKSLFATASASFHNTLFLDVTTRRDKATITNSSKYTNPSFSAGVSFLFSEMLDKKGNLPDWLTAGQVRLSAAKAEDNLQTLEIIERTLLNDEFKPSGTTSYEGGVNLELFNHKMNVDITIYRSKTTNQPLIGSTNPATGYQNFSILGTDITSSGFEAVLGTTLINSSNLNWNSSINLATFKNKISSMHDGVEEARLGNPFNQYGYVLREGGELGEIFASTTLTNRNGQIVVWEDGERQGIESQEVENHSIGNINPKLMIGWRNQFTLKNVDIQIQIDGRFGGKAVSATQSFLNYYGRSKASADARDAGGLNLPAVDLNGNEYTKPIDPRVWYSRAIYTHLIHPESIYKATNVRIRELTVGYTLPKGIISKLQPINQVKLSFVAYNLLYLYRDAPFDPDVKSFSLSSSSQDLFSIPMSRSISFNINITI